MTLPASRRGFTLVEFIIAVAVFTFGVSAVYSQFIALQRPSSQRLLKAQARMFAHQGLEELRACEAGALASWTPEASFSPLEVNPRFWIRSEVDASASGPIVLTVRVGWNPLDSDGQSFNEAELVAARGAVVR